MRRIYAAVLALMLVGGGAAAFVALPDRLPADVLAGMSGDVARGEQVFWAGGCASCHATEDAEGDARLVLKGGRSFPSPFGTFVAPNISSDPEAGIGAWSDLDLANAMTRGVSPGGQHYYPVFPYASYARAELQDVVDLRAFLATLPADPSPTADHDVGFPFNIRLGLGLWKLLFLGDDWVVAGELGETAERGRYLAEALGHCGECHTPRNALGGLDTSRWLAGAPNPTGRGTIPNITPGKLDWSETDITAYFKTGFTPDFDSAGGHMAEVIKNLSQLPEEDLAAITAYLKAVPAVE